MIDTNPPPSLPTRYHPAWRQIILDLRSAGTLNRATPAAIAALAAATHQWQEATNLIDQTGTIYDDHGTPKTSPAVQVQNQAAATIARLSRQLGLHRPGPAGQAETPTQTSGGNLDVHPGSSRAPARPADKRLRGPLRPRTCARCAAGRHGEPWFCDEHKQWHGTCHRHGGMECHGAKAAGLDTCRMHAGGRSREKMLAAKAAPRWVPIPTHPAEGLLASVAWWAGQCAWLDEVVNGLQAGDLVWGLTRRTVSEAGEWPGTTTVEESTLNLYVSWQQKAQAQYAQVCRWALEAAAEERLVRLAEAQGAHAFAVYQAALRRLGLSEEQWALAREAMPEVLKELTAA